MAIVLDFADGNLATPVGTDQMTMLASTVKMIEPKAKKKLELETRSERDIFGERRREVKKNISYLRTIYFVLYIILYILYITINIMN